MTQSALSRSVKVLSRLNLESVPVFSSQKNPSITPHWPLNKIQTAQLALFKPAQDLLTSGAGWCHSFEAGGIA